MGKCSFQKLEKVCVALGRNIHVRVRVIIKVRVTKDVNSSENHLFGCFFYGSCCCCCYCYSFHYHLHTANNVINYLVGTMQFMKKTCNTFSSSTQFIKFYVFTFCVLFSAVFRKFENNQKLLNCKLSITNHEVCVSVYCKQYLHKSFHFEGHFVIVLLICDNKIALILHQDYKWLRIACVVNCASIKCEIVQSGKMQTKWCWKIEWNTKTAIWYVCLLPKCQFNCISGATAQYI